MPAGNRPASEGGGHVYANPNTSITPLGMDFEKGQDGRSSRTTSVYSRSSARTQTADTASANFAGCPEAPVLPMPIPVGADLETPYRGRTDRQMQIEQKIIELQGRLITASGHEESGTRAELMGRIEKLKDLRESGWAYGAREKIPDALNE
ncbi:hypothetical protein PM082_009493 [Marasmius tenuissimus]|nr:hypothetical protein PM082_009493 [Marasmius tenuissimus]